MKTFVIPAIIAILAIPVAISLASWFNAAPVPIEISMDAPLATQARICWDAAKLRSLRLVPVPNGDGVSASVWLAELPPRPAYELSIAFEPPYRRMVLHGIKLIDNRHVDRPIYQHDSDSSAAWFTTENMRALYAGKSFALRPAEGARLSITDTISIAPRDSAIAVVKVWLFLTFILLGAYFLVVPLLARLAARTDSLALQTSDRAQRRNGHCKSLWIAFAIATIAHITLILHSPVVLAGGDSAIYLLKGLSLARHGSYGLGGLEFEVNRLPGYPLLLCLLLKTVGYRLTRIAVVQGLLFCGSVMALALATRGWIKPWIGAVAIIVAILSPAQVWGARTILSESTFGSFSNFALAALFMHIATSGKRSKNWLIAFGCLATYAVFIRPNGIALYAALVPVYVPALMGILSQHTSAIDRLRSAVRFSLQYLGTAAILVAAMLGWSLRNYHKYGYFGASDMTGVTLVCGLMVSGSFDANSLPQGLYDGYVLRKYNQGYYYSGFFLRHDLMVRMTGNGRLTTRDTLGELDRSLREIAGDSGRISPWQVHAIGLLRSAWWAVAWPDVEAYSQDGIRLDYVTFENNSGTRRGAPSLTAQQIREDYLPTINKKLVYDDVRPNRIFLAFSSFAELYYDGWYVALFLLSLLGTIYALWRGDQSAAAPMYAFVANILINVYLLNVFSRYIHIMDAMLVFQCAIAMSQWLGTRPATPVAASE